MGPRNTERLDSSKGELKHEYLAAALEELEIFQKELKKNMVGIVFYSFPPQMQYPYR